MKTYKLITTRIDLYGDHIYSAYDNAVLLSILNKKYANICFSSCLIISVDKIIRRSVIEMSYNSDGSAYIDILCQVTCIVYSKGDIITDCKINAITDNIGIWGESEYANIQLLNTSNITQIISIGDSIPVTVSSVRYQPGANKIAVIVVTFMPSIKVTPPVIYHATTQLQADNMDIINILNENITQEEAALSKLDKKVYTRFKSLLYPYTTAKVFEKTPPFNKMRFKKLPLQLKDITSNNCKYLYRPAEMEKDKAYFYSSDIDILPTNPDKYSIIECSLTSAYTMMLSDYLKYIRMLRELTEAYSPLVTFNKYKDIWSIYTQYKNTI